MATMDQGTARRTTAAYSFTLDWQRQKDAYVGEVNYVSPGLMPPKPPGTAPVMMQHHGPETFRGATKAELFDRVKVRMVELGGTDTIGPDDFKTTSDLGRKKGPDASAPDPL